MTDKIALGEFVYGYKTMLKSIHATQKLFKIDRIKADGQVDIRTSEYLLSLSKEEQIGTLTIHLAKLKKDLAKLENSICQSALGEGSDIQKTQLQILINIIENLLSRLT